MIIDQIVFAPTIIAAFFVSQAVMEGKSTEQIKDKLSRDYLSALKGAPG